MNSFRFISKYVVFLLLLCSVIPTADALDNRFPYFTNDRYDWHYAHIRTINIPQQLNLNTASFNQLLTLPEVTEPVALAILEQRPFANLQALNKLSARLSLKQIEALKQILGNRIKIAPAYSGENASPLAKELLRSTVYNKPF